MPAALISTSRNASIAVRAASSTLAKSPRDPLDRSGNPLKYRRHLPEQEYKPIPAQ